MLPRSSPSQAGTSNAPFRRNRSVCVRNVGRSGSGWGPVIFAKGGRLSQKCEGMALIFRSVDERSARFATGVCAVPRRSPIVDQYKAESCGLVPACETSPIPALTDFPPTIPTHTPAAPNSGCDLIRHSPPPKKNEARPRWTSLAESRIFLSGSVTALQTG
jgi:hypothetical protein